MERLGFGGKVLSNQTKPNPLFILRAPTKGCRLLMPARIVTILWMKLAKQKNRRAPILS